MIFACPSFSSTEGRHMLGDIPALNLHIAFISISIVYVHFYAFAWQARSHALDYMHAKDERWSLYLSYSTINRQRVRERKYLYFLSVDRDYCLQQRQESSPDHESSPSPQDYASTLPLCMSLISIFHHINDCFPQLHADYPAS